VNTSYVTAKAKGFQSGRKWFLIRFIKKKNFSHHTPDAVADARMWHDENWQEN